MAYRFTDLVEISRLESMLTALHEATGLAIGVADADGTSVTRVGWQDICLNFHRACPQTQARCWQSDDFLASHPNQQACVGYRCPNGLLDYVSPVIIEGERVATLFSGQLFHEPPDEAFFRRQAQEFGFDLDAYMAALRAVPIIPKEQFRTCIAFLTQLTQNLASAGLERRRLLETTAALEKSEEAARRLGEDLERRVVERTAQLGAVNRELSLREAWLKQAMASLSETAASLQVQISVRERAEEALHRLNNDLLQAQKRTYQVLHTLEAASGSLDLNQVLERIAGELAAAIGLSHCIIYLLDPNGDLLIPRATAGELSEEQQDVLTRLLPHSAKASVVWATLENQMPLISSDTALDPRANQQLVQALGVKSLITVPIQRSHLLGVALGFTVQEAHTFSADEVDLAMGMASAAALAIENAELYEKTRRRLAESESFARVMVSLVSTTELEHVLDTICTEAQQLIGATGSTVFLLEEDGRLHLRHCAGSPLPIRHDLPASGSLAGLAIQKGTPVLVNDAANHVHAYGARADVRALLIVPLQIEGKTIGVLDVVNKPGGFDEEDVRIMSVFASQVAMAIEHARLHRRAAELAVLEERQRLARDLHDSVTQALYGVTLFANATSVASSAGKQEAAAGYPRRLRDTAQEAMADMRLLIFQLRPPVLEKNGLIVALQARLAAVEARTGLQTEFRVEGEERRFPSEVEEQLYWIAQEALNNVLKHAKAHQVTVHLAFKPQRATLEVSDDGIGFDISTARENGGVGLRSIEERVAKVQGKWTLESQPGHGTRVLAEVSLSGAQVEAG